MSTSYSRDGTISAPICGARKNKGFEFKWLLTDKICKMHF